MKFFFFFCMTESKKNNIQNLLSYASIILNLIVPGFFQLVDMIFMYFFYYFSFFIKAYFILLDWKQILITVLSFFYCIIQVLLGYKFLWVVNFAGRGFCHYVVLKSSLILYLAVVKVKTKSWHKIWQNLTKEILIKVYNLHYLQ